MTWIYRGKTALITGASSGIGEAYARALAQRGCNVLLVARSADKLQSLAAELQQCGVQAAAFPCDLSRPAAVGELFEAVQQRGFHVDLLLNSAGFGIYGRFETLDPDTSRAMVLLNSVAVLDLCHAFIPPMLERGEGAVVNVASTSAFQPTPYLSTYGATKAFMLSLSEALWAEYRGRGVRVVAVCPGPVETPFFNTMGSDEWAAWGKLRPEQVVKAGLRALEHNKSCVVVGAVNLIQSQLPRISPRALVARVAALVLRPRRNRQ